tara:strand:+ start:78 stop:257 length:180 start_codon:yes stop_codon:yes gene_type:complete
MLKVGVVARLELLDYLWYHMSYSKARRREMYNVSGVTKAKHLVLFVGYLNWLADKGVNH